MDVTRTQERRTLEVDGCAIAYRLRGSGPPVLFVQGVGLHGDGWNPQIDALSDRYSCLSFDNRGIGGSARGSEAISVERLTSDAIALLDHAGWESAHVVGHSLGGQVAIDLGLRARSRVRSLALLCTFARGRDAMQFSAGKIWSGLRSYVGTRRMRRRAFLEMVFPKSELDAWDRDDLAATLEPIFGHDLADHPAIERAQLAALARYDARPRLAELAGIPTLVVSAHEDRIATPASGLALSAGIPGSLYLEIPGAGHGVPIQNPDEINRRLEQLFASR